MKHLRDTSTQPDLKLQTQLALQARQQLGLDCQVASPQLATPVQKVSGLPQTGLKPGLGYAPASEPEGLAAASQQTMAVPRSDLPSQSTVTDLLPLQQQSHSQQPTKVHDVGIASGTSAVATKHWQGPLYVISHKGEELVCDLAADAWPSDLPRCAFYQWQHSAGCLPPVYLP